MQILHFYSLQKGNFTITFLRQTGVTVSMKFIREISLNYCWHNLFSMCWFSLCGSTFKAWIWKFEIQIFFPFQGKLNHYLVAMWCNFECKCSNYRTTFPKNFMAFLRWIKNQLHFKEGLVDTFQKVKAILSRHSK